MARMEHPPTRAEPEPVYRVEHRVRSKRTALGSLGGVRPHHMALEPFVGDLLRRGLTGEVVLVDEATGTVVARRRIAPFGPRAWRRAGGCQTLGGGRM